MTDKQKPTVIVFKESLAQSVISDFATFGMILLCVWVSRDSAWWTLVTGCIFLFFVVARALETTKGERCLRFYSLDELREWVDKQENT